MPSAWHRIMGGVLLLGSLLVLACGRVGDGPAPRLTSVVVAASAQRGAVDLAFSLADESGAPLSLRVEFRLKNDPTWRLAESAGGLGQGFGLLAGPQAATYHFIWDSAKDAAAYAGPAALRVTVRNPYHRAVAESPAFTLANDNAAPTLTFAQLGPLLDRRLPITLTLRDGESEPLGLGLRYAREAGGETYPLHLTEAATLYESSPSGKNVRLFWDVAADLGMAPETTVWLEAVARDALGAGPALRSAPIPISLGGGPALRVLELSPSLRGLAPITFIVYGDPNRTYTLRAEFRRNVATAYTPLSQEIEGTDATRFLNASAQGQSYVFTWNTLADFPQKGKTRGVGLRFELRDAYEQPFVPPQLVEIAAQGIDNAPLVDTPLISEIYPGVKGQGAFIELYGPPGYNLSGHRLYEVWPDGSNGLATGVGVIVFGDERIDASGLFVIAAAAGPAADHRDEGLATFFKAGQARWPQKELPNSLILDIPGYDTVFDAVGYGDFASMGYTFQGQGRPSPAIPLGSSLVRDFGNTTSKDNSLDFILGAPSPKSSHLLPTP